MRMAVFVICFFLLSILTLLAEQLNLEGWPSELIGWIGGILVGIVGLMLLIDWNKKE